MKKVPDWACAFRLGGVFESEGERQKKVFFYVAESTSDPL